MATQSFYADNLYRDYPFVENKNSPIPKELLLGLKIHCDYSTFFTKFPLVFARKLTIDENSAIILLEITDGNPDNSVFVALTVPRSSEFQDTLYFDTQQGVTVTLIAGDLSKLPLQILTGLQEQAEPTLLVWAQRRGINSIRIANQDRERLKHGENCIEYDWPDYIKEADWWLQPYDAAQKIKLIQDNPFLVYDGYNCAPSLLKNLSLATVLAAPVAGLGSGAVAEDLPLGQTLFAGELVPETLTNDLLRYDGIPPITHNVYSFCNLPGPEILLESTKSIQFRIVQSEYTIYADVHAVGSETC